MKSESEDFSSAVGGGGHTQQNKCLKKQLNNKNNMNFISEFVPCKISGLDSFQPFQVHVISIHTKNTWKTCGGNV